MSSRSTSRRDGWTTPQDRTSVDPRYTVLAVGVSIGGLLVHNLVEFPISILFTPETLTPAAVTALLGAAILRWPSLVVFAAAAIWAVVVVLVGGGSVLPLPIWPFVPEQTITHYAAHAVYALAQLPLLWVAWRGFRAGRQTDRYAAESDETRG